MRARLAADFARFGTGLPANFPEIVRETYRIDLTARYLDVLLPHPIGKGSGQLSLNQDQLETDADAGLAFTVLKTVIAQDAAGDQSMSAWAIHESKMSVEPLISATGKRGWTVTWKGRGWDRTFDDYLELVKAGRDLTRAGRILAIPSVKYHLPTVLEPFRSEEYTYTTRALLSAWGETPLLLEKDFSPTLAGDALAGEEGRILRWIKEVPEQVAAPVGSNVRLSLKLMNSRFGDDFQLRMLETAVESGAAAAVVFNRLFGRERGVAYGGWDLSDRNLRVLDMAKRKGLSFPLSGTGNICSGTVLLDYARRGCSSVQLHTFFQLPLGEYAATVGSRTSRALHMLVFHPLHGLIAGLLNLEADGTIERRGGELHFLDLVGQDANHSG
jgi:hypothetical protein